MHNGVDIANDVGTPIFASSNGVVNEAGWNDGGYGNRVVITSPEGILTTYNHLEAIFCSVGQQVVVGQRIGDMGNTGYSTGPHLHFEIKINGDFIDPEQCLRFR
jgi:murein DD-endopeptidase MepM/ murein hydrolase activator NlpD